MPANTPRGFPYPLPTEPVAQGAHAIRNLAESIDSGLNPFLTLLAEVAPLAAGQVNMQFNNIPQTHRHLLIVSMLRDTAAAGPILGSGIRFNGAGTNYYLQSFSAA